MQKIVINDVSQLQLFKTHDRVEVCDDEGNLIGYFVSCHEHDWKLYEWASTQLSDDELRNRKNQRGAGRATADVIKRLKSQ
jgi:hypothetical protein